MNKQYLLGFDIGSSSIKAALVEVESGKPVGSAFSPSREMEMLSLKPGFAEQDPEMWWRELVNAINKLRDKHPFGKDDIAAIGISYQMHGLVCVDISMKPLRPSIIWCDSRAVEIGNTAFKKLGADFCLSHYLNSPGNFTATKLAWVRENEPEIFERVHKIMLPGDYIALKLTGEPLTSVAGLSEGIMWDFREERIATELLDTLHLPEDKLCEAVSSFGQQGTVRREAAEALGLREGIPVSYRSGDQPNNAFSLNVLEPGEIAATAGTSGVVYGVTDTVAYDPQSRVNTFVHVNNDSQKKRFGILLCINGTGSLNSWLRKEIYGGAAYEDINREAEKISIGSDGLLFYPYGNGAERVLENKNPGAGLRGLQFNSHGRAHLARAAQEGIVFSLNYGISVMKDLGLDPKTVRAGYANMFLSDVFARTFANVTQATVELYNTDGALGAARAAGVGSGIYDSYKQCFRGMEIIKRVEPDQTALEATLAAYSNWAEKLTSFTN